MNKRRTAAGKVLLLDVDKRVYSEGHTLYVESSDKNDALIKLPVSFWYAIAMRFHLVARLLRLGVHHLIKDDEGGYYCIYNKQCARFSANGELIGKPADLRGGRPLRIDMFEGEMVYGEYRSNSERKPVAVYAFNGYEQKQLFQINDVRHVHAVRVRDNKIYFSTGDYDKEAGVWCWDGEEIRCLLQGGQQRRAVDFLLTDDGLYYGTDTPLEQNYIYKASYDGELTQLQEVGGSVFYMSEQAGRYWLATVVEPSEVNVSPFVELWVTASNDKSRWHLIGTFKKDKWPMKLFQYGQIQFPYVYQPTSDDVWFYLQGVKGSGSSVCTKLDAGG